jgi:uncharacterized membrane protein
LKMNPKERREKVYALRKEGLTFREIGLRFGFCVERARQLYLRAQYERELLEQHPFAARISARCRNALARDFADESAIFSPGRVAKLGRKELLRIKNLGRMSAEEISTSQEILR